MGCSWNAAVSGLVTRVLVDECYVVARMFETDAGVITWIIVIVLQCDK